ncbi:MAG: B12-binding domain-containing radical SAM protein [Candidatus Paceibacterales bacterium]
MLTVYLCDLTHIFQNKAAADTIPLGIGCLAAFLKKGFSDKIKVSLFKFPEDLSKALEKRTPDIIGFSNYVCNLDLSYKFAERIKQVNKETVVVFGGPNYPQEHSAKEEFFKEFPAIDFYVKKEGELAFALLVKSLLKHNLSVRETKKEKPKSADFVIKGKLVEVELLERFKSLDEIDSPYLTGLFDEFLKRNMMPLLQTDRGCPFSCSYCCEGDAYYCFRAKRSPETAKKEIRYIAERSKKAHGLFIANSNFGMYPEDVETAREIARLRAETGWPHYINVATGKENKKAVIKVSEILKGALRVCASVQSTDEEVLKAIKRRNVPLKTIAQMAEQSRLIGSNTYSEIILALPKDSKEKFLKSVKDMIELDLNFVLVYTLMLLQGSELATKRMIKKYGIVPKYRILPRCLGNYRVLGKSFSSAEIERVGIANSTLSFSDYLTCRVFFLVINLFYNDGIFEELVFLLKKYKVSVFEWLCEFFNIIIKTNKYPKIKELFRAFLKETKEELWDSKEELSDFVVKKGNIDKYLNGELGSNLAYKYKALGLVKYSRTLHEIAFQAAQKLILPQVKESEKKLLVCFLEELKKFSIFRKADPFDITRDRTEEFQFNFVKLTQNKNRDFAIPQLQEKTKIRFFHKQAQIDNLSKYLNLYGDDELGISRILSRVHIKEIFRKTEEIS